MHAVVFGAGSLGSLIGGLLAREHDVTLVGRDPHVTRVREKGLQMMGDVETTVYPSARLDPPDAADLAIVTVKAFDTDAAAAALSGGDFGAVLSLQNGMGNEERLAAELEAPVLAGTCTYGAVHAEAGVVRCTGIGRVVLGAREGGASPTADRIGRALSEAGIVTTVADDMPRRLWMKLAVNAGINATTALVRIDNGALLDGEANAIAVDAAREVACLARAEGIDLADDDAVAALERVATATADNTSSMRQDVMARRRTEIEAIGGYVAETAAERGVDVPVNRTMTRLLRAWESARGLR